MEQIRGLVVQAIAAAILGLSIPVFALLVAAAISERVRRMMLVVMVPTAITAVIAYFIFAPAMAQNGGIQNWGEAGEVLETRVLTALPYLLVLILAGVLVFLFGPSVSAQIDAALHRAARRRYLQHLLDYLEPLTAGTLDLPSRALANAPSHIRLSGVSGSGKTTALRRLAAKLARAALQDENAALPMLVDLDDLLVRGGVYIPAWEAQAVPVSGAARMLAREARAGRLILLADTSQQHFSPAFNPAGEAEKRLVRLARLVEECDAARVVLALPPDVHNGALLRLLPDELALGALSDEEIGLACKALCRAKAQPALEAIFSSGSTWSTLAGRVYLLRLLARFFERSDRLPKDLHELFSATLYPQNLPADVVEESLGRLAAEMLTSASAQLGLETARQRLSKDLLSRLAAGGLLRFTRGGEALAFEHALQLAYFTALSWQRSQTVRLPEDQQVNAHSDPILADALVFFNNLEADPGITLEVLLGLANERSRAALFLASQCLLAMPAEVRPAPAVDEVAGLLLAWSAEDAEAASHTWRLLEPADATHRAYVIAQGLKRMEPSRAEVTMGTIAQTYPDELYTLLMISDEDTALGAGYALIESDTRLALELFTAMLDESEQVERKQLAVRLLGRLPGTAAQDLLLGLVRNQPEARLRQAALRSLGDSGAEITMILLELAADGQETDEMRALAAQMLAFSDSPQLQTGGVIREIVRISRMPLPPAAQEQIYNLLETLRAPANEAEAVDALGSWFTAPASAPGGLNPAELKQAANAAGRWENILNPFVASRPVSERHMFFGREVELHQLRAAVENGSHCRVTGERQIGKTSLLYRLLRELHAEAAQGVPVRAAYLDVTGLMPHEFLETVLRAAIEQINDPGLAAEADVPRPYTDRLFERDLGELMAYLCSRLGQSARLALLLDGVETLHSYPPEMHAALRRIFESQGTSGLVLILAGGTSESGSLFYSAYPGVTLGPLTRTDALRLITQPVMGAFQFEPQALELILQASRGRPRLIQALCQQVINQLLEQGDRTVSATGVQAALSAGTDARGELQERASILLDEMLDWLENHPEAGNAQVEGQVKQAWEAMGKLMVQGVVKLQKSRRAGSSWPQ